MTRDDSLRDHIRKARDASRVASDLADRAAKPSGTSMGRASETVRGASIRAAEASFALDDAYHGREAAVAALGLALRALQDATAAVRRAQETLAEDASIA